MMQGRPLDVAIAYRIYPRVSKPTPIFASDKLRLAELCVQSFRGSLGELRVKMWVLLDGCPPEYERLFQRYFDPSELELIRLNGVGNEETFRLQLDLLLEQTDSELVYFAEDDYFYLPGQFSEMVHFLRSEKQVDFVSPYDHPDYYTEFLHGHKNELRLHSGRHWRTAASTCLTFLTTRETLKRTESVFRAYVTGRCSDASLWFSLTKRDVWRLDRLARAWTSEPFAFRVIRQAWRRCGRQVLFGDRWKLWVPVPSIATHMESAFLAPGVDWQSLFSEEEGSGSVGNATGAR
jgi:hypothetical protein